MTPAKAKLLCLHHAGGAPSVFESWTRSGAEQLDVVPMALPAHPDNARRRRHRSVESLVPELAEEVEAAVQDGEYVLFGHSMGALLAYLLTVHFEGRGGPNPRALVVSCFGAPQVPKPELAVDEDDDEEFARRLHRIGGLPTWLLDHPEWLSPFLGTARDDVGVCTSYRHDPRTAKLAVPVRVFGADDDGLVPAGDIRKWSEIADDVEVSFLPGGHFLVSERSEQLRKEVFEYATRVVPAVGTSVERPVALRRRRRSLMWL